MPGSSQDILAQNNINRHHVIKISNGSKIIFFFIIIKRSLFYDILLLESLCSLVGWSVHHVFYPIKDM